MASRQPSFQNIFSPGYSFLPSFYSKDAVGDIQLPFSDAESSDEESEIDADDDTGGIYPTHSTCTMVKKRSSLQSIFAPTFLYTSPPPKQNRTRSSSYGADFPYHASSLDVPSYATLPRCHSPPRDLIDDDPFANLASPPSSRATAQAIPVPKTSPRSPLSPKFGLDAPLPPLPPKLTRTSSGRAMPAHQKPAFTPRPSLPSLHTLSQMNLILPKKVRKGKVGAGLPFEPWDDEPVASGSSSVLDPIADEQQHHVFELEDTSDEDIDFHFSASAQDEDIDVGLDYPSYTSHLALPSKHSHSGSTSSTSSLESLPDDDIFSPYDLRHYSTSPEPLSTDDLDWECTPTPPTSMYIRDPDIFQPGTSADTITLRTVLPSHRSSSIMPWLTQDVVDGDDWDRRAPSSTRTGGSNGGWAPSSNGRGTGGYGGPHGGGKWNGSGDGGGDDRRGDKPRRAPPAFSPPSSSEESEEEESADEYGKTATTDDDDVPLAQRIPTALKAQRTIRLKVREERDQRRKERAATRGRPPGAAPPVPQVISSSQEAALHASKSIRRPRTHTISGPAPHAPFAVEDLAHRLQNVQASIQPSRERVRSASPEAQQAPQQRTLRPMRSFHRPERRRADEHQPMPMPEPDQPLRRSNTRARSRSRADDPPLPEPMPPLPRASMDDRKVSKPRSSLDQVVSKGMLSQQRIFVGDRQRFNMVEVSASTNAGEVIGMVEAQGTLKGWVGSGGWMLWEVAQDFGMERPIRSFELLADVEASWNKDKMVNIFVLKLTPLAPVLSRSAVPSSSPVHSGYVEWEIKRGKWVKRWMTLREHSLFLAKRDNGKDETLVCSLSNFDAYFVTRLHKAPKPFVFSVKSTDNISFFENTADYLHIFACSKADGDVWMEKILLARSYVLHQERNVLFNPKAGGGNGAGTGLSRALTRKGTTRQPAHAARPQQTLVDVGSPDLFEPGSLLHRK